METHIKEPWDIAIEHIKNNNNILLTGGAGVGKSYTLRKILEWADNEAHLNVARTALTGMASLQFEMGETLHRCLGIGLAKNKGDLKRVIRSYKFSTETIHELKALDLLVIDEVSMLRSDTLELIDALMKHVFNDKTRPFGGLQVIFSGDFMQLPPIVKPEEKKDFKERGYWAFHSPVWKELDLKTIYLKEIKRQDDPEFAKALNMIRTGTVNPSVSEYFNRTTSHKFPEGVEPVRLLSTNKEVNTVNQAKLKTVRAPHERYEAQITAMDEKYEQQIKRDCPAMENLELKVGAQVMIIINSKNGEYVNGSMGEYMGMIEKEVEVQLMRFKMVKFAVVKLFETGEEAYLPQNDWKVEKKDKKTKMMKTLAIFRQFPIKLGWAITIHKSQGMSLDYLKVDLGRCFADGMAYVALSRARNYDGLIVNNWKPQSVKYNQDAFDFYIGLKQNGEI